MTFLYSKWRALDLPTRIRIASDLGIKKVGPTHVRDNIVESDGYLIQDVEIALSLQSLHDYFKTDITDAEILWEWLTKGKPEVVSQVTSTPPVELSTPTTNKNAKRKKSK